MALQKEFVYVLVVYVLVKLNVLSNKFGPIVNGPTFYFLRKFLKTYHQYNTNLKLKLYIISLDKDHYAYEKICNL